MLDAAEWRILSYLALMEGRTRDVIMGALALREEVLDEALQRLKGRALVLVTCGESGDRYFITTEGKRQLRL
jgi:hypothetical protein